jgi:chromosome segregation ATPase
MAEMNELLEQAIHECEGLTAEAGSFAEALAEMARLSGDERDVLEGARATVSGLHESLAALKDRDAQLDQRQQDAQAELERLDGALEEREAEVAESREKLEQAVRELVEEKERLAEALRAAHEHGREELEALRERFEGLEEQAEEQLQRSEEAIARLEETVRAAMDGVREAQAALTEAIETAQEATSARVDGLVGTWEAAAEQVAARAAALGDAVQGALGEALDGVRHAFEEQVPQALDEAGEELGVTLRAVAEEADELSQVDIARLQSLVQAGQLAFQAMSNVMGATDQMLEHLVRSAS